MTSLERESIIISDCYDGQLRACASTYHVPPARHSLVLVLLISLTTHALIFFFCVFFIGLVNHKIRWCVYFIH